MPTTQDAITAVVSQPIARSRPEIANRPMAFCRAATSITAASIGTAITPLSTAVQNSALIGLTWTKFIAVPASVATAITA